MAPLSRYVRLAVLALCFAAGAAGAQVMVSPGAFQRAQPQTAPQNASPPRVDPANVPELARAEIERLRARNRELRQQFSQTLIALQDLRHQLDETTRPGGSLVRAYCDGQFVSRNSAGASENCAASGYVCAPVSGLCHRECSTSDACAGGFTCDPDSHRCIVPPPAEDD